MGQLRHGYCCSSDFCHKSHNVYLSQIFIFYTYQLWCSFNGFYTLIHFGNKLQKIIWKKLYGKNMVPCLSWVLWTTRRSCFAFKSGKSEILMVLPRRHESCCQQHITLLNIQMPHSCSCCVVAYLSYEVFSPLCQAFNCRINLTGSAGLSWLIYLTWLTVTAYRGSCMKCEIVKHSFLSISGFLSVSDYPRSLQESCRQPFTWSWYLCQD